MSMTSRLKKNLGLATATAALLSGSYAQAAPNNFWEYQEALQHRASPLKRQAKVNDWSNFAKNTFTIGAIGLGACSSYFLYTQNRGTIDKVFAETILPGASRITQWMGETILAPAYSGIQNFFQTENSIQDAASHFLEALTGGSTFGGSLGGVLGTKVFDFAKGVLAGKTKDAKEEQGKK